MFSQFTKNLFIVNSITNNNTNNTDYSQITSGGQNGSSLFLSIPTFINQSEAQNQSIALESSTRYNKRENDNNNEEYQSSFLLETPIDTFQEEQPIEAASIYKDAPPLTSTITSNNVSLSENLLPSCSIPPPLMASILPKKNKDLMYAVFFVLLFTIMMIDGMVLLFTTSSTLSKRYAQNSIFFIIRDSIGLLFISIVFSLYMVFLWTYLLYSFVQIFVRVTVKIVPFAGLLIFVWTIREAFTGALRESGKPDPQDDWLAGLSFVVFISSLICWYYLYTLNKNIEKAVTIIQLACRILRNNIRMIYVSYAILFFYTIFVLTWLLFFSRVFLLDSGISLLIIFYSFMYFWTTSILTNIQRVTISSIVSDWYFHRNEPDRDNIRDITSLALTKTTTTSFGTVCFGSLILSVIYTLQTFQILIGMNNYFKQYRCFSCFSFFSCLTFSIGRFIDEFSNYIMIYVGVSGENFLESWTAVANLFEKNHVHRFVDVVTLSFTRYILFINSLIVTLIFGFGTFIYATHILQSPYGYVPGILSTLITFYILRFYTLIITNTVDAVLVCYAIDIDNNKKHCNMAHKVFSNLK